MTRLVFSRSRSRSQSRDVSTDISTYLVLLASDFDKTGILTVTVTVTVTGCFNGHKHEPGSSGSQFDKTGSLSTDISSKAESATISALNPSRLRGHTGISEIPKSAPLLYNEVYICVYMHVYMCMYVQHGYF